MDNERKKEDIFIKEKRRAKNFFITSSNKMAGDKITKTTISSSHFIEMSASFASGDYLLDEAIRGQNGSVIYMLQQMQEDIDDLYNEASSSAFMSSFFPIARIDTGSFGQISSSGTSYITTLNLAGTNITAIKDEDNMSSNSATSLATQQSIKAYVDANAGGDLTAVDSHIVPDGDNTRDLGSSTKEFRNLYIDGTAYIDSLAGTSLTAPIRTVINQVTKTKGTTLDATLTDVFEFNIAKAVTVDLITPSFPGQEITIMNIGSGAITITRSAKGKGTSIYGQSNLTINQNEAYKFVVNSNQIWYVIS